MAPPSDPPSRETSPPEPDSAVRDAAFLTALVQGSQDAIISMTPAGIITSWNPAAEHLFGWTEEEVLGEHLGVIIPDDRETELHALHSRVRLGERVPALETVRRHKDGSSVDVSVSLSPVLDGDGRVVGISAIDRDIAPGRRIERQLERQHHLLRMVVDAVPALVSYVDTEQRYRLVSAAYHAWFGILPERIEGLTVRELLGDEEYAAIRPHLERALRGESVRFEHALPAVGRGERIVQVEYMPDVGEDGDVRGLVAMVRDTTDRARYERELEEADRRKDEFLAMLAHELRNPIAPLVNGLQILREFGDDADNREYVIDTMSRQTTHLIRLVDDLLDASRVSQGKVTLALEPLDARGVVEAVFDDLLACAAGDREIDLEVPDQPVPVLADPVRLTQMVDNLTRNACKYTEEGGRIRVALERDQGLARIRVEDDGQGIHPDLLPRIFELFTQGERSLDRSLGGLGIGLTLVEQLARLHDGSVSARSEGIGQGASFEVVLPLTGADTHPDLASLGADAEASETPRDVLVVEDDEDVADMLKLLLEGWGHHVRLAADGPEAIEQVERERPELVLVDIGLPRMDGYEVTRELRSRPGRPMSIVMLSGYGQRSYQDRAAEAGADAHLTKPARPEALREILRAAPTRGAPSG